MTGRLRILNTIPSFSEEAKTMLAELGNVDYLLVTDETIRNVIGEYEVLVVGLGCSYSRKVLAVATKLKVIATATTGLDHIDTVYAQERGIEVLSLRGENEFLDTITGTAELAFGLLLSLMRHMIPAYNSAVHEGVWKRELFRGLSLYGKTLGIVGMGRLGKIMAYAGAGFRMNVIFYDPHVEQSAFPDFKKVSFEELLAKSDAVSIHCHLLPETKNIFNEKTLTQMKPSAYLINTARGEIVDEGALLRALEGGVIAGYGADVLDGELEFVADASASHALVRYAEVHNNVIIVPHIGGMTSDSRVATDVFITEKLAKYLRIQQSAAGDQKSAFD